MNTERLLRLAAHLETVPEEVFDMRTWATRTPCGTVCCALGHACSIPEFAAAGLSLIWTEKGEYADPVFRTHATLSRDFQAAAEFFGIGLSEAHELFDPDFFLPDAYPDDDDVKPPITPADVAARIRQLVAAHAAGRA